MARERNYAAEYAARKARSVAVYGKGYGAKGGARERRASNRPAAADKTARPTPRRVEAGPGRAVTVTSGRAAARHVRAQVEAAAAAGGSVAIQVTFANAAGEYRTRRLQAPTIRGGLGPDSGAGAGGSSGQAPAGSVQVVTGDGGRAADWLALFDDYDGDIWECLYDQWDLEVS